MSRRAHLAAMVVAVAGIIGSLGVAVTPAAHSQSTENKSMNEPCWSADPSSKRARECRREGWVIERRLLVTPDNRAWTTLPACVTEDSDGCYWNARLEGNHEGRSFVNPRRHGVFFVRSINGTRA